MGIHDTFALVDAVRVFSKLGLFLVSTGLMVCLLRVLRKSWMEALSCGILLGGYLVTDPGLAHLKPIISNLYGKGHQAFYVGFDRPVSPSVDILYFAAALWMTLALVTLPQSKLRSPLLVAAGGVLSILLLAPPFYGITYGIFVGVVLISCLVVAPAETRSCFVRLLPSFPWLLMGGLPAGLYFIGKTWLLLQSGVLDQMLIRVCMISTHAFDGSLFRRTFTIMVALGLIFVAAALWRKSRHIILMVPLTWTAVALLAFNQQVITGRDLQNFHFEWTTGYLLGVSLCILLVVLFEKRLFTASLLVFVGAFVVREAVITKNQRDFESCRQPLFGEQLAPSTFEIAREINRRIGITGATFAAPRDLTLAIEYFSGWRPVAGINMFGYSYDNHEIWRRYVMQAALSGQLPVEVFLDYPKQEILSRDQSYWYYGLPCWIAPPQIWFSKERQHYLPIVRDAAQKALSKPLRYDGPFPLVTICRIERPLPQTSIRPDRTIPHGRFQISVWNRPFQVTSRSLPGHELSRSN